MIRDRNIAEDAMIDARKLAGIRESKKRYLTLSTGNRYGYLREKGVPKGTLFTDFATAYAAMTTGRNDVLNISPDSHSQAATNTIANSNLIFFGEHAGARLNHRSRIGHSANFSPMFTISGSANEFHNLYWMHGRGSATNLQCLAISGDRNGFINCHIGGPMNATESAEATYKLINITGQENYFSKCVIGIDTITRSAANCMIETGSGSARNVFEDCVILSASSATSPFMLSIAAGADRYSIFRRCSFINFSANWSNPLLYAVTKETTTDSFLIFEDCWLYGISDWIAAARVAELWMSGYTNTSNVVGLAINPAAS